MRNSAMRFLRPVQPFDLSRTVPVSRKFGMERGKAIDRHYMEAFLENHRADVRGRVMEIAESTYSVRYGGDKVTAFEVLHVAPGNPNATLIGDLTKPESLPEGGIDCFICTQTLNFIYDFHAAIRGLHRLLSPGGKALVTLAGISQISRYDMDRWGDYWRFTSLSARKAFEDCFGPGNVEVTTFGNPAAAMAFLQGMAVEDLPGTHVLDPVDPDYQMMIAVTATRKAD